MALITMRRLGALGRWGNQIFEYMFLRTYARRCNLDYQCGRWIGQQLMGHNDPPVTIQLKRYRETRDVHIARDPYGKVVAQHPQLGLSYPPKDGEVEGKDMDGYCQFHTSYYAPNRHFIRDLFVPIGRVQRRMDLAVEQLRKLGTTLVGLHLRRGDSGRFIFYVTPNEWYLRWLEEHWSRFNNPILFIASEDPEDMKAFTKYSPVTSSDLLSLSGDAYSDYNYLPYDKLHPTPLIMDWFPDWYLLTKCGVLALSNSTFGFTAAMMSRSAEVWRSRLSTQEFELTDPWNARPMTREDLSQYPGVPGTGCQENLRW